MSEAKNTFENFNIKNVEKNIEELTDLQKKLSKVHKLLLLILKNYSQTIDETNFSKKYYTEISNMISAISKNIETSIKTTSLLRKLLAKSKSVVDSYKKETVNELEIKEYIFLEKKSASLILKNYEILEKFTLDNYDLLKSEAKIDKALGNINNDDTQLSPSFIENTLIISEVKGKVFLPYTLEKIQSYIAKSENKNLSIQEVIDSVYTVPLSNYKKSVTSRFTEAFKLVRQKEHGSIKDALDLAFELAFNYNLHPAIITACNNINELDIYLACMEYNELDNFRFFNINFEMSPMISKKNHKFPKYSLEENMNLQ